MMWGEKKGFSAPASEKICVPECTSRTQQGPSGEVVVMHMMNVCIFPRHFWRATEANVWGA